MKADRSREWPHEERRKNPALRQDVDNLLQHLRDVSCQLESMTDDEVGEVERRFLSHAHMIWDTLLEKREKAGREE